MKMILPGVIALVIGIGAGVGGRLILAPPAAAKAEADTAEATTPKAEEPKAQKDLKEPESSGSTSAPDMPMADVKPQSIPAPEPAPTPTPEASTVSATPSPSSGSADYAGLSRIVGKMQPAEVATLIRYCSDDQAQALLESLTLKEVSIVLKQMPSGRAATLRARLLGSVSGS